MPPPNRQKKRQGRKAEPVFRIKPELLEWKTTYLHGNLVCHTKVAGGRIEVRTSLDGTFYLTCGRGMIGISHWYPEQAKAAADRWYRQQLRKALVEVRD